MSVTETAEYLGLSRQRVLGLIAAKQVPARKIGNVWAIRRQDAQAFKRLPRGVAGAPRKL